MTSQDTFIRNLELKVQQQLASQNVGYLLGAGASYLDGRGYPLAGQLWGQIADKVPKPERDEIQSKLDSGADGIENALDLIDDGAPVEKPHRRLVTDAIAELFLPISPPIDTYQKFVQRLASRNELSVPVFSLNYDGLVELAADAAKIRVVDGFAGLENRFFEPQLFQERFALTHRGPRKPQADWRKGIIHLYKLHGSLGWYQLGPNDVRRYHLQAPCPSGALRLMVPPQRRKAIDTTALPYAALWSDLRGMLCHGPQLLNRLVSIGYGLRDEHLNAIIENALARGNFTLLAFSRSFVPEVFTRWSAKKNVILVTNAKCSIYGAEGPGHPDLWSFENLSGRV
jgi:hypothetical protein